MNDAFEPVLVPSGKPVSNALRYNVKMNNGALRLSLMIPVSITVAGHEYRARPEAELIAEGYQQLSNKIRMEDRASEGVLLGMFAGREAAGVPWAISLHRGKRCLNCVVWVKRKLLRSQGRMARVRRKAERRKS